MEIVCHENPAQFAQEYLPLLLEKEAENALMIGIVLHLSGGGAGWSETPARFYIVKDQGAVVGLSVQTPPFNPILSFGFSPEAVESFTRYLHETFGDIGGVLGENDRSRELAECWCALSGMQAEKKFSLRIYKLTEVTHPKQVEGYARYATPEDLEVVADWHIKFHEDVGTETAPMDEAVKEKLLQMIGNKRYMLWCNPDPVSIAGSFGDTVTGVRIAAVYTPPQHRAHGYASGVVAALSEKLLEGGRAFCTLFTDLANPTSNSIYQKIGYKPVCDYTDMRFLPVEE